MNVAEPRLDPNVAAIATLRQQIFAQQQRTNLVEQHRDQVSTQLRQSQALVERLTKDHDALARAHSALVADVEPLRQAYQTILETHQGLWTPPPLPASRHRPISMRLGQGQAGSAPSATAIPSWNDAATLRRRLGNLLGTLAGLGQANALLVEGRLLAIDTISLRAQLENSRRTRDQHTQQLAGVKVDCEPYRQTSLAAEEERKKLRATRAKDLQDLERLREQLRVHPENSDFSLASQLVTYRNLYFTCLSDHGPQANAVVKVQKWEKWHICFVKKLRELKTTTTQQRDKSNAGIISELSAQLSQIIGWLQGGGLGSLALRPARSSFASPVDPEPVSHPFPRLFEDEVS